MFRSHILRTSAIALAAVIAACAPQAPSPNTQAPGATVAAPSPTAKLPDALVIDMAQEQIGFDSDQAGGTYNATDHIFDTLVALNQKDEIIPRLATRWESPDEKTWVFHLRQGVKFTNGEAFNAQSVKYSLERVVDPKVKSQYAQRWKSVGFFETVEIRDDYTVAVKTSKPSPLMLVILTDMYMRPPNYYSTTPLETVFKQPIGSGPYKLKEWVKDERIVLEANAEFWGGKPAVSQITFKTVPEPSTRLAELRTGAAHIVADLVPDQIKEAESATTRVSTRPGGRIMTIPMVTDNPSLPMSDKRVRQAINHAVDVKTICATLMAGACTPYSGPITPPNNDPSLKPYAFDPERARQLLKDAGFAAGFSLTIDTPSGRYVKDLEVVQAVAQYLGQVGIKASVKTWDWTTYLQRIRDRKSNEMYFFGQGGFDAPYEELYRAFDIRVAIYKAHGWANKDFYAMVDKAGVTIDPKAHLESLWAAQRILWEDAPVIFLYHQPVVYGVSKMLNWEATKSERIDLRDMVLQQR